MKFCVSKAALPIATDLLPKVSEVKAKYPSATSPPPVVKATPARPPIRVLSYLL